MTKKATAGLSKTPFTKKAAGKRPRTEQASQPADQPLNRNIFRDMDKQNRYETIKKWSFIPERRVLLNQGEYPEFYEELNRRSWNRLADPLPKFDPHVVKEFYANAWAPPTPTGGADKRAKVRGRWVSYDRDAINEFLGNPLALEEGQMCHYQRLRQEVAGFTDGVTARKLCLPGRSYEANQAGRALRILRGNMKTITQIWMTFMLANIAPNKHSSDLNMKRCYLIYSILSNFSVDVATIISEEIRQFVIMEAKTAKALGFPALITALCAAQGVEVNPTEDIRPTIDRKFIEKNCVILYELPQQQGDAPQSPAPGSPCMPGSPSMPAADCQSLQLNLQHIQAQLAANHRGQVQLHDMFYRLAMEQSPRVDPSQWMTPAQFADHVAWPGDRPTFAGEGASGAGSQMHEDDEDEGAEEMVDQIIGGD